MDPQVKEIIEVCKAVFQEQERKLDKKKYLMNQNLLSKCFQKFSQRSPQGVKAFRVCCLMKKKQISIIQEANQARKIFIIKRAKRCFPAKPREQCQEQFRAASTAQYERINAELQELMNF